MAYATHDAPMANASATSGFGALIASFRDALARRKLYKATLAELSALSTRDLADLGLNRSMIRRAALEVAYGKK